ncbi:hypothetical protein SODG_006688 [Sodalis praecaptivus]
MSTEMLALLLAALLCLLLPLVYSFLYQRQVGVKGTMGNRETVAPPTGPPRAGCGRIKICWKIYCPSPSWCWRRSTWR